MTFKEDTQGGIDTHIEIFERRWEKMTTIASGSLKPAYKEAGKILQQMGYNELLKKELLLATLPKGIMKYSQLVQNLRKDDNSYGDIISQLKQYVPQLLWKKRGDQNGGETSISQSGSLVTLNGTNPVIWGSRRQETTAQSITEAEYIACAETMKDIRWIHQLLPEIIPTATIIIPTMYTDNEAAAKLTKTQTYHQRSRHIEHKYHFIREMVERDLVKIKGIAGKENPADVLTKLVPMSTIKEWRKQMDGDG